MIGFAGLGLGLCAPVGWRAARQRLWAPHSGAAFEPWSRWPPGDDTPALEQALLAATLAPSNLNTQPWRFRVEGNRVDVYVDPTLPAAVADPFGRERCLSVGCAIENFVISARTVGLSASVALVPGRLDAVGDDASLTRLARIETAATEPASDPLREVIGRRRTHRGPFHPERAIESTALVELAGLLADEPTAMLAMLSAAPDREAFGKVTLEASEALVADARLSAEHHRWYRYSWRSLQNRRDGIPVEATGIGDGAALQARLLPAPGPDERARHWLRATREIQLATSPMFGLLAVRDPGDRPDVVRAGRIWQRMHLWGTQRGIAMQPLNQAVTISDLEQLRGRPSPTGQALAALAGGDLWRPVLAFRMGHPVVAAPPSPRRALAEFLLDG